MTKQYAPDKRRAYDRKYREQNRARIREQARQYYLRNKEKVLSRQREYKRVYRRKPAPVAIPVAELLTVRW